MCLTINAHRDRPVRTGTRQHAKGGAAMAAVQLPWVRTYRRPRHDHHTHAAAQG